MSEREGEYRFMFNFHKGIHIVGTSLWLDAEKKVELSFISHAHADHVRKHEKIIASDKTISFYRQRIGDVTALALPFNEPLTLDGVTIEIFPSGHILGASQIKIERDGLSLIYSGDFKLRSNLTAERIQVKQADILIMECTFGLPCYRFPSREFVIERLVNFVDTCFRQGVQPVIMAYSLGKGQETLKILGDLGYRVRTHKSIYELAQLYRLYGIEFKNCIPFEGEIVQGEVLLIPPQAGRADAVRRIKPQQRLLLSGWAVDPGCLQRYKVDAALPLSDHADFDELIHYVELVKPKKVYITHGFQQFASYLKKAGFNAEPLKPRFQLSLF